MKAGSLMPGIGGMDKGLQNAGAGRRIMKLKRDKVLRSRFFTPGSYAHPAKGHLGLWWEILERYTKRGEWILDPMAGVGATMLGALMGRNVVCVELEQHFIDPMKASSEKMRMSPMLGCELGQVVILRGDARCLPLGGVNVVVTSPPYEGSEVSAGNVGNRIKAETWGSGHSLAPDHGYTRPEAIITSPPYEGTLVEGQDAINWQKMADGKTDKGIHVTDRYRGYTRPAAIVTSPPFQDQEPFADKQFMLHNGKANYSPYRYARLVGESRPSPTAYSPHTHSTDNIGNLRNAAYWEAMQQVYAECWRVLRPGGILALVLKGFTRDGKYVDLPGQTEALLLTVGWEKHDEWRRELWSLSFWRILQRNRDPAAFDNRLNYETVLAFRKGVHDG